MKKYTIILIISMILPSCQTINSRSNASIHGSNSHYSKREESKLEQTSLILLTILGTAAVIYFVGSIASNDKENTNNR